jgi:hypothetical protein
MLMNEPTLDEVKAQAEEHDGHAPENYHITKRMLAYLARILEHTEAEMESVEAATTNACAYMDNGKREICCEDDELCDGGVSVCAAFRARDQQHRLNALRLAAWGLGMREALRGAK